MIARISSVAACAVVYLAAGMLVWTLVGLIEGWSAARGARVGLACGLLSAALGVGGTLVAARWSRRRRPAAPDA